MEIISGVERRRRWSDEAKLRILSEADQPGARIGDVARHRRHGQNERGMGIGRKNWLFAGSDKGCERIANILTIIETAKLHGHNPEIYLTEVLTQIKDYPVDRLEDLLPWNMPPAALMLQEAV
jgi:transposase